MKKYYIVLLLILCSIHSKSQENHSCNDSLFVALKNYKALNIALTPPQELYFEMREKECNNNLAYDSRLLSEMINSPCKDIRFLKIHYNVFNNLKISIEDSLYYNSKYSKYIPMLLTDYILPKNGVFASVKIVEKDSSVIYFRKISSKGYKSIRKMPLSLIDKYSFNSQYNDDIKIDDSTLFDQYLTNSQATLRKTTSYNDDMYGALTINSDINPTIISKENKDNTALAIAGAFIIASGVIKILNNSSAPNIADYPNPDDYIKESDKWLSNMKTLDNISNGVLAIGGFTLIIASINF